MKANKQYIGVRLKESTIKKIDKIAESTEETRSETIRRLVENQIAQIELFNK